MEGRVAGSRVRGAVVSDGVRGVLTGAGDDALVARARRGDPEAFAVLYHRHKLDVWHLAWFTLRDHHEAEDVVQETFVKAHRALAQHRAGSSVRAWLLTICRNACRDRARQHRRRDALPLDEELAALADGDHDHERALELRRALHRLPDEERAAFLVVDVLGCTSQEAARVLGVRAPSTLRSRLARARAALAPAVQEDAAAASPAAGGASVWGLLHAPPHSVVVLAAGGARDGLLDGAGPPAAGLLAFLDRVDGAIPAGRPVTAVVDDGPAAHGAAAARWLAGHPRWQMRRAPTHATWLAEVEALLGCDGEDRDRVRALLSRSQAFEWTCAP